MGKTGKIIIEVYKKNTAEGRKASALLAVNCPVCGKLNTDNWPVTVVGDEVEGGGCLGCWEAECDAKWWQAVESLAPLAPLAGS